MKIPKGGMYGAAVLTVLVALAIFATVALNVDQETVDVTKYDYVTDISGLFDYDKSPQYFDYDLAENYTGYYTATSSPYWGGVDYEKSSQINRYWLNLQPTSVITSTENLSTGTWTNTDPPGEITGYSNFSITIYGSDGVDTGLSADNGNLVENRSTKPTSISLADLLTAYGITDYNKVTLSPSSSATADRIIFASTQDFVKYYEAGVQKIWGRNYVLKDDADTYTTYSMYSDTYNTLVASFSCIVDNSTGLANLYSSPTEQDQNTFVRSIDIEDLCIVFGGTTSSPWTGPTLGSSLAINAVILPPNEYLDISQGVKVNGSGSPGHTYSAQFVAQTGGSVSRNIITGLSAGTPYTISGNTVTINGTIVTATANAGYNFVGWEPSSSGSITGSMVFTAKFEGTSGSGTEEDPYTNISMGADFIQTIDGSYVATGCTFDITFYLDPGVEEYYIISTNIPGLVVGLTPGPDYGTLKGTVNANTAPGQYTITVGYEDTVDVYEDTYTVNIVSVTPAQCAVSFSATAGGSVSPSSSITVDSGTAYTISGNTVTINGVTVTATANNGYHFTGWSPSASGTVTGNMTFTASFAQDVYYTITFSVSQAGGGTVSTNSLTVLAGTPWSKSGNAVTVGETTVTATPDAGKEFYQWENIGGNSGTVDRNNFFLASFRDSAYSSVTGTANDLRSYDGGNITSSCYFNITEYNNYPYEMETVTATTIPGLTVSNGGVSGTVSGATVGQTYTITTTYEDESDTYTNTYSFTVVAS